MGQCFDFIAYHPVDGVVNVYEHADGSLWYGSIYNREESDKRLKSVRATGGKPIYRVTIRTKPSPNTGS